MSRSDVLTDIRTYEVDPAHSTIEFKVRHLGFSRVTGRFTRYHATFEMAEDDLTTLSANVEIDASSVDTGDEKRDAHLRSADFFEAETYSHLRFESTAVQEVTGDEFVLEGKLTIRDVTRTVELKGRRLGEAVDPWGGRRIAFEGSTKIRRGDYGLKWNQVLETGGMLVGDDVEIILEVQGVEQE